MALKPWYRIDGLIPREDLREGKPLEASEFAVHLDHIRDKCAPNDYQNPQRFFERTYLTKSLIDLASQVMRRLCGEKTGTNAIFNLSTQFGGGKTHALTLLYHLANNGRQSQQWTGVNKILSQADINTIPKTAIAVFVGTEFDSLTGRGGNDGTPLRKTPWGEIAYQLGGEDAFEKVKQHENEFIEPKGDVIRSFLPKEQPCLILMDEIINYVSTYRSKGYHNRLYNFIQALCETARGMENVVLVVSIPASEMEYTDADEADEQRFKKMLDRLGKAIILSAESETSEIIRRRLFEWDERAITHDGRIMLPRDAIATCNEYADWVINHRTSLPSWFPIDDARETFAATYPFHPTVLSVFERKWQVLPRFQRTRGVLRLLALWVSHAYQQGYKGAHRDPLIGLGTAPLEDPNFRTAVFEQLGENRLEGAITTDICGNNNAHAFRLDREAEDTIKKARLHRKTATIIFFESNGGQSKDEATLPEIRLAIAEPDLDIVNVETVLDNLRGESYYLLCHQTKYRFSLYPNLNKILADRRANINSQKITERVKAEIQKVFTSEKGINIIHFPEKSKDIPNRAELTLAVLAPDHNNQDEDTFPLIDILIKEAGQSARTYKSAIIFAIADSEIQLREEARKLLAWEDIRDNETRLDNDQKQQLTENLQQAKRDLKEAVWRSYKTIALLDKQNKVNYIDFGLITSSQDTSMVNLILHRLQKDGEIVETISPHFLYRKWSPAFKEWSIKNIRDTFFASAQFPRLLKSDALKTTIVQGVKEGIFAYVGKGSDDAYQPFIFKKQIKESEIEVSDEVFLIKSEDAEAYLQKITAPPQLTTMTLSPSSVNLTPQGKQAFTVMAKDQYNQPITIEKLQWQATGGTIDEQGVLTAGKEAGNFTVTATVENLSAIASYSIVVESSKIDPKKITEHDEDSKSNDTLAWKGEIIPQQWTVFYTKVLTKFASDKNLCLTLIAEFTLTGDIPSTINENTKAALAELGLENHLEIEPSVVKWQGHIIPQKWMNFYSSVLAKFVASNLDLWLELGFTVSGNISQQKRLEVQQALSELGLSSQWADPLELSPEFKVIIKQVQKALNQRQGQAQFRAALLKAYQEKCAITNTNAGEALEAAHIKPYQGKHTNQVTNGLLLRADIHTLFDRELITIHPQNKEILISPQLEETIYKQLNGKILTVPENLEDQPDEQALEWRYRRCSWVKK